jgi:hypothetical protein
MSTPKFAIASAALMALSLASGSASAALTITTINNSANAISTLVPALLAPSSGIAVSAGTETYQGTNTANFQQSGTYSGFSLAPSSGSSPFLSLANGIFLTSGSANIPLTNTLNEFTRTSGSGGNAQLTTLAGTSTNDANVLSFKFSVAASINSVSAKFVFGTDEFPTQTVTDIFGFFVDGVNYAKFSSGELISNTPGNPTNFISNLVGSGLYGIEYNGLTQVFDVTGLLGTADINGLHTISIGIADTIDTRFDSGVFVTSLTAGVSQCSGIGCEVLEPGSLALFGLELAGLAGLRQRKSA